MTVFESALDTLTARGYSNALELANEIEYNTIPQLKKKEPKTIWEYFNIASEICLKYYPTYYIKYRMVERQMPNGEIVLKKIPVQAKDMDIETIMSRTRRREVVIIRQIIATLFREECRYSWKVVGGFFGNDHSTAINSVNTVHDLIDTDKDFRNNWTMILLQFRAKM